MKAGGRRDGLVKAGRRRDGFVATRSLGLLALCLAAGATGVVGQERLSIGLAGARAAHDEVTAANRQEGFGVSGVAVYRGGGWAVEGEITWRTMSPTDDTRESFTSLGGTLFARYAVWRELDVEVGYSSRSVDPEFVVQDVALVRAGLRYEADLARDASVWIRGAAIPVSWFNGGGGGGLGVAVGFGARAHPFSDSWSVFADYDFERLDRTAQALDVPIQLERFRVGVALPILD